MNLPDVSYEEYLAISQAQIARDRAQFTGAGQPSWSVRIPNDFPWLRWRDDFVNSLLAHMWDGLDARITNQKRTRPARAYRKSRARHTR